MKRRVMGSLLVLGLMAVVCGIVWAASWSCDVDGNKKGTVDSLTIDMTKVLFADVNGGWDTKVHWPGSFDHYNGIVNVGNWTKNQIVTPSGNFVIKLTARLAGCRKLGYWRSKRNVVTVEVHDGQSASGAILQSKTLDTNVGSPTDKTIEVPQVTADLTSGNSKYYTIILRYDKYDGEGGDDGYCGMTIKVEAD